MAKYFSTMYKQTALMLQSPLSEKQQEQNTGFYVGGVKIWPLPTFVALGILSYAIPSTQYLNRGFTVWFHLVALLQFLTQSRFLVKFQALIGCSICLGWYASLVYDYMQYGKLFHILYRNMPSLLTEKMIIIVNGDNNGTILDYESWTSINTMFLSHVLDTLGHPLLTFHFWRQHQKADGGTLASLLSWDVILSTWIFSRCWSFTHTYYNFQTPRPYYFGYDVYVIDEGTLDLWFPAYVAESLFYTSITVWKLFGTSHKATTKALAKDVTKDENGYGHKPNLLWSESSISQESIQSS